MDDIEVFKHVFPDKYFYEFWLRDRRSDNRNFTELRKMTISRSGSSGFILSSGNNVVQATYEIQQTKVKINTDTNSLSKRLYDKIVIQFAQESLFPLFDSCVHHLKKLIVKKYEACLSKLKLQERIVIDLSALFYDVSLINTLMVSIMIGLYECFVYKCGVELNSIELMFPVILKSFYISEKEALLWIWDPSKEELTLNTTIIKSGLYLIVSSLDNNKQSFEKLEGTDMSFDDLANLSELLKDNLKRSELKSSISSYLKDISVPNHRII